MQKRELKKKSPTDVLDGYQVIVDKGYWDKLQQKDSLLICNRTLFRPHCAGQLLFDFLGQTVMVDMTARCLKRMHGSRWEKSDDPLLELVTVLYLNNVGDLYPVGTDIVGAKDLREGHFFRGPHALQTDALLERYGRDVGGFRRAAESLQGQSVEMAAAAYRLLPFPRLPLYYLLWEADEEFSARMTILFDRFIEKILAADAIWALVNRVSAELLKGCD
jgi:hypothetical protein